MEINKIVKEKLKEKSKLIKERIGSIPIDLTPYIRKLILLNECEANLSGMQTAIKSELEFLEKLIFAMQQSRDCFGYNPHKVFTTNLCYGYAIEGDKITASANKLLGFAMGCYKNGWLEAINQFQEIITDCKNALKLIEGGK